MGLAVNSVNVANGLTVARILLVPVVVVALLSRQPGAWAVAAVVFFLAASTDGLPGGAITSGAMGELAASRGLRRPDW